MPSGHLSGQGGYVQGGFVLNFKFKKKLRLFINFRSGGGGGGGGGWGVW